MGRIAVVRSTVEAVPDSPEVHSAFAVVVPIITAGGKPLGAGVYRHVFSAPSTAERDAWIAALSKCVFPFLAAPMFLGTHAWFPWHGIGPLRRFATAVRPR